MHWIIWYSVLLPNLLPNAIYCIFLKQTPWLCEKKRPDALKFGRWHSQSKNHLSHHPIIFDDNSDDQTADDNHHSDHWPASDLFPVVPQQYGAAVGEATVRLMAGTHLPNRWRMAASPIFLPYIVLPAYNGWDLISQAVDDFNICGARIISQNRWMTLSPIFLVAIFRLWWQRHRLLHHPQIQPR